MYMKKQEYFDPQTNKFPYPIDTDKHYLVVKKNDGTVFDEKYPYIDYSKEFRRKQNWSRVIMHLIFFPFLKIRMGLKVKGKENLKKYKDVISKGVISIANHVHMWDYASIVATISPIRPYILSWAPNISGENGFFIRMVGGIPIPENNNNATFQYFRALRNMLNNGGWLHLYPEGSMWEYYAPIRPFKIGASFFSVQFNKPIFPMAFSYRRPGWIRRKIFKQIALYTLNIGEPIYPDMTLPKNQREEELTKRSHDAVCKLAGIDPEKNIYPKIFNNSKRIDYYTDTYGVGYKKSW